MKLFTSGTGFSIKHIALLSALFCFLTYAGSAGARASSVVSPVSTSVCAGDTASFVSYDTFLMGVIQWQLSLDSGITFTDISGATDTIYSFSSLVAQSGYRYRAVITDTTGNGLSDTSSAATLTVFTPSTDSITTRICPGDSFVIGTQAYYTSGTFNDTLHGASVHGCDSIVTLNLTVYATATDSIRATICPGDSFVVNTQAYYTAGTYSDTIHGASVHGCDSIVVLNLSTYSPATKTLNKSICQGSHYIVGTDTFTTMGTFSDTLFGRSVHGCDSIVTLHLTVNPTIIPSITISANTADTICQNTVVNLLAAGVNGGNNADYQWKRNGTNVGNSQTYIANPIRNGDVFWCVLTSTATCATPSQVSSDSITFTVNAYPAVSISSSGSAVCPGDTLLLTASGGGTYLWSSGATTPSISTVGGTYTVTATNSYGCTAGSMPLTISVVTAEADSLTQIGDTLISGPSQFYQWYQNDSVIGGAIGQTYIPTHTGSYQVAVIDSFGCRAYSSSIYILETGITTVTSDPSLRIYPNPSSGIFTLEYADHTSRIATVTDALGRVVLDHITLVHQQQFDMHTLTEGIYYMHVSNGRNTDVLKFSIVK